MMVGSTVTPFFKLKSYDPFTMRSVSELCGLWENGTDGFLRCDSNTLEGAACLLLTISGLLIIVGIFKGILMG